MILEPTDRAQHVRRSDGFGDIVEAQPICRKPCRVHQDLEFLVFSAGDADLRDAGNPGQHWSQLEQSEIAQGCQRHRLRGQAIGDDRENGRIHPQYRRRRTGRQLRHGLVDCGVDLKRRRDHVGAPFESDRNLRSTAAGCGAHISQPRDPKKSLLYRCRDLEHHLLGGTVAGIERNPDARELDVGKQCHR